MKSKRPILITGSHRSGTTWVGRILAESPSLHYIHEPFNPNRYIRPCACGVKFTNWFQYISQENEAFYYKHIAHTIGISSNLVKDLIKTRHAKDLLRSFESYGIYFKQKILNNRPLMKDPIAIFSTEWLASRFNMDVVVLIRHPAAFAGSLKRNNWSFQFSNFLKQPLLMKDHLYPFQSEITEYANKKHDIIDQASLLWKIIYNTVIEYKKKHANWIFIRHEDISREPILCFQGLFSKLNLNFSENIKKTIIEYTESTNISELPKNNEFFKIGKLNSKANIYNWKNSLTTSEIQKIKNIVKNVANRFYCEEDWG